MNANPKCNNTHVVCGEYLMMYDHEGELVVCSNCNVGPTPQPASKSAPAPIPSQKLVSPAVTAPAPRAEPETKIPQVTVDERKKYEQSFNTFDSITSRMDFSAMCASTDMWCNRCQERRYQVRNMPDESKNCKFCNKCGDEMVLPEVAHVQYTCGACDQQYTRELDAKCCGKCGSLVSSGIGKHQKVLVELDAPVGFDAVVEFTVSGHKLTTTMLAGTDKALLLTGDIPHFREWYRGTWIIRSVDQPTLVRRVRLSHLQATKKTHPAEMRYRIKLTTVAIGEIEK